MPFSKKEGLSGRKNKRRKHRRRTLTVKDIRDRPYLEVEDVVALNFIRHPSRYLFRRHYRTGLRSHLFEVLDPGDVAIEASGIRIGDHLSFPRASPLKMLRLFRARFMNLEEALQEIARVQLIMRHLSPAHVARSDELLVDYRLGKTREILLCGLQEYVGGEILNPWGPLDDRTLAEMMRRASPASAGPKTVHLPGLIENVKSQVQSFVTKVKKMIAQAGHIPDLAGIGNLILTADGRVKLVDINNVSPVLLDQTVYTDDHGYPVCDKSIEALVLLERKILGRPLSEKEEIYGTFLEPLRMKAVAQMVRNLRLPPEKYA
jgi:hypothetical protein